VAANRDAVEHIADVLVERREMHGDEVLDLLEQAHLTLPEVDLANDESWPVL
jgi:cell division protease FtsH